MLSDELSQYPQHEAPKRRRLLSEMEAPVSLQPNACSVEDVLQLMQLLYAVSSDASMDNNLLGTTFRHDSRMLVYFKMYM